MDKSILFMNIENVNIEKIQNIVSPKQFEACILFSDNIRKNGFNT